MADHGGSDDEQDVPQTANEFYVQMKNSNSENIAQNWRTLRQKIQRSVCSIFRRP